MFDEAPASAEPAFDEAHALRLERRYAEALALFRSVAAAPEGALTDKRRRHAFSHALTCAVKLSDWSAAEAVARECLARFPANSQAFCRLGEALLRQRRFEKAVAALQRAIELDPADREAPLLLELARSPPETPGYRPKVVSWPKRQSSFEDPRALIRRYVLGRPPDAPIVEPDSVFMALGSCFAQNLAMQLQEMGRTVHAEEIGEDVNSTYANRWLLDWVENGPTNAATMAIQAAYGPGMRERIRAKVADSDVFVITLGVAACFFRRDDGAFAFVAAKSQSASEHLYANHVMRTTRVEENVDNLRRIMASISRMARRPPRFVLTVSPVPLGGTTEGDSAVIADCLSKSTLRLAAEQICAGEPEHRVVYWPSFEIVRWLGPHFGRDLPAVFAADDRNSRHVSRWLVRLIVELFLEHHAGRTLEA